MYLLMEAVLQYKPGVRVICTKNLEDFFNLANAE